MADLCLLRVGDAPVPVLGHSTLIRANLVIFLADLMSLRPGQLSFLHLAADALILPARRSLT
ncbi:MAG: hypothetical protein ACYCP0_01490 [Acidiferrobacteraceae bacterium]